MTGSLDVINNPKIDKISKWQPVISDYTKQFLSSLPEEDFPKEAKTNLLNETFKILSCCHNPKNNNDEDKSTGLVIGRVQSGKTTSFKTLSMLAADNGFKLIILFAGRTNNLINQNLGEFEDLKAKISEPFIPIGAESGLKSWKRDIPNFLSQVQDLPGIPGTPIMFVVNKHAGHINSIANTLKKHRTYLRNLNTLIIDDEADNASLNTAKNKDDDLNATPIYKSIKNLRNVLTKHSVVQYTATPQALLLISEKDHYSPEWARVISPGEDYLGAKELFLNNNYFYEKIDSSEIPSPKNLYELDMPESLETAFRTYLLSAAQYAHEKNKNTNNFHKKNCTFMVHPHVQTKMHGHYETLLNNLRDEWKDDIENNIDRFFRENKNDFLKAYKNLKKGVINFEGKIEDFEVLFKRYVPLIISRLAITQVNKESSQIPWQLEYNVIVGGYMLDRGYVVRGLLITYMPRSKGGGQIDSLQQRGRFYGYKRKHIGFIKSWMEEPTIEAYKGYAKHEIHLYKKLKELSLEGKELREWERILLLDKGLKPCRKNVISKNLKNDYISNGWYIPKFPVRGDYYNENIFGSLIRHYYDSFNHFSIRGVDTST